MATLSIIIGTLNEAGNIAPLLSELNQALTELDWEVIFVDDASEDGTADYLDKLATQEKHIHVIHRKGERGLASACMAGLDKATSPFLAVMDADLQHDPQLLPQMMARLIDEQLEIVVASRFVEGGARSGLSTARTGLSRTANAISRLAVKSNVSDLMSGYFLMRRELYEEVRPSLDGMGFKLLLDILASANRALRCVELAADLRPRHEGNSKLDSRVIAALPHLLFKKVTKKWGKEKG